MLNLTCTGLTASNLADNFAERTIINDDLNMAGYRIFNLQNSSNDQDTATQYYVNMKQYNINSASIAGNLPWNRLSNILTYFPSKISIITADLNLDAGSYKFVQNGIK